MLRRRAWCSDHLGTLEGELSLEACHLALEVGGVRFEGDAPEMLRPVSHSSWAQLARSEWHEEGLRGCELEWEQPVTQDVEGDVAADVLLVRASLHFAHDRLAQPRWTFAPARDGRLYERTHTGSQDRLDGQLALSPLMRSLRCSCTCAQHIPAAPGHAACGRRAMSAQTRGRAHARAKRRRACTADRVVSPAQERERAPCRGDVCVRPSHAPD